MVAVVDSGLVSHTRDNAKDWPTNVANFLISGSNLVAVLKSIKPTIPLVFNRRHSLHHPYPSTIAGSLAEYTDSDLP